MSRRPALLALVAIGTIVAVALPSVAASTGSTPFGGATRTAGPFARSGPIGTTGSTLLAAAQASLAGAASTATAPSPRWNNVSSLSVVGPVNRTGAGLVYDGHDGLVILFGGFSVLSPYSSSGTYLNDTWGFSASGWSHVATASAPSPRSGGRMVYDATFGAVVLFGGYGPNAKGTNGELNDTWSYVTGHWSKVATASRGPSARDSGVFVYDARDRYSVYFGGETAATTHPWVNDTWKFAAGAWTNLTSGSTRAPSPRSDASIAFDAADQYVVLYGGFVNYGTRLSDCWTFSGGRWSPVTVATPPAREGAMMTYDGALRAVVLTGGQTAGTTYQDTWQFQGGSWSQLTVASPGERWNGAMAYDDALAESVLFSGWCSFSSSSIGPCSDTWTFTSAGIAWGSVTSAKSPSARAAAAMAYDDALGVVVLFGGDAKFGASGYEVNDTWEFAGSGWTSVSTPIAPSPRDDAGFAYDAGDGYLVLFGGSSSSTALADTWTFGPSGWTKLVTSSAPSGRVGAAMAYDPLINRTILFGGDGLHGMSNDTWSFSAGAWTNVSGTLSVAPGPRLNAAMTYSSLSRGIVLFGGIGSISVIRDTWIFTSSGWSSVGGRALPTAREFGNLVFDPLSQQVLLVGGQGNTGPLSDEWAFDGKAWTQLAPVGGPGALEGACAAWDASRHTGVVFGGVHTVATTSSTWAIDP